MSIFNRIRKDINFVRGISAALIRVIRTTRNRSRLFPDVVEELAERYGDRTALLSDRETLSFEELNGRANRYARWAKANGIGKGETVCLLMPNRPEYVAIWVGIARAGGVVGLLNTNLTGAALAHCINVVAPAHVIIAEDLAASFTASEPLLSCTPAIWSHGSDMADRARLDTTILRYDDGAIAAADRPELVLEDRCLFIYTSGTTGLPKAANINHYRVLAAMEAFSALMSIGPDDRMYDCLPLYHTSGGVIAICASLRQGASVFIRERFSARQFWEDVVNNDCTLFQYIGELCRYLVNAPVHPLENQHRIRLCCGNGLRPDVWGRFSARFGIAEIREFYAATEGNAIIFNFDNTPGSVGRVPRWAKTIFPLEVIRIDLDSEEPVRDSAGFCEICSPDEVGELVSRILLSPLKPGQRFDGYSDRAASEKKVLRGAFETGDEWFRSGDLMRRDERGYFFFVDRLGDTFRWKGENVATSEVAELIDTFTSVQEANVYGVAVAGREGKAGMVAMVVDDGFDMAAFRRHLHAHLSPYARPLFVRLQDEIESTSTFKQRKLGLVRDGFDPSKIAEPLFFDDSERGAFVPLDAAVYSRIQSGEIRL